MYMKQCVVLCCLNIQSSSTVAKQHEFSAKQDRRVSTARFPELWNCFMNWIYRLNLPNWNDTTLSPHSSSLFLTLWIFSSLSCSYSYFCLSWHLKCRTFRILIHRNKSKSARIMHLFCTDLSTPLCTAVYSRLKKC